MLAAFPEAVANEVADGWEERWRSFHRPVEIGPLWIGQPWQAQPSSARAVVIDPGRAFGTGAHATTRLCLELLVEQERGSLLDLGCGSGVIAIAAAKLGFAPVWALDSDPVAVEVTRANAEANGVTIDAETADALSGELPLAAIAVANIALEVVLRVAPRLASGALIASGYRACDRFAPAGFTRAERRELDGWSAELFRRD